jgi:hypothetical protein
VALRFAAILGDLSSWLDDWAVVVRSGFDSSPTCYGHSEEKGDQQRTQRRLARNVAQDA